MAKLTADFYNADTVDTARRLLGKILVRRIESSNMILAGEITETEAYIGRCDKACHAYGYKKTERTRTLFMSPGHAYIYMIYGMYHCLNFVTEPEGEPAAVLIRGMAPLTGVSEMWRRRYGAAEPTRSRIRGFLNGPGKICQALDLTRAQNGMDLTGDILFVCNSPLDLNIDLDINLNYNLENNLNLDKINIDSEILARPRIGIDYAEEAREFPWRFILTKPKFSRFCADKIYRT